MVMVNDGDNVVKCIHISLTSQLPSSGLSNDLDERMLKLKEKLLSEKLTRKRS